MYDDGLSLTRIIIISGIDVRLVCYSLSGRIVAVGCLALAQTYDCVCVCV